MMTEFGGVLTLKLIDELDEVAVMVLARRFVPKSAS